MHVPGRSILSKKASQVLSMQQQAREGTSLAKDTLTQRVGGLVAIPALLREFGVEPGAVLAKVRLPADALDHIDNRIPFDAADGLLGECVASTGCAHFGLLVGQRWGLSQFGALGELMRHSGTVGEALQCMAVNQHLNSDVGAVFLLEQEGTVSMGYALYRNKARHPEQVYDTALAITRNLLRELCGSRWVASEVIFSRAAAGRPGALSAAFSGTAAIRPGALRCPLPCALAGTAHSRRGRGALPRPYGTRSRRRTRRPTGFKASPRPALAAAGRQELG